MISPTAAPHLYTVPNHLRDRYLTAVQAIAPRVGKLPEGALIIDRLGWSPRLAAIYGRDYLATETTRAFIVLSPDQFDAPIAHQRYSFEDDAFALVLREYRKAVLQIVEHEAAIIMVNLGVTGAFRPYDLFTIQRAVISIDTPRHTLASMRRLMSMGDEFVRGRRLLDTPYITEMLALQQQVGDPRTRNLPQPLELPTSSFWSTSRGVTYVLRTPGVLPLVISSHADERMASLPAIFLDLQDPEVLAILHDRQWLAYRNARETVAKRIREMEIGALLDAGVEDPPADEHARRALIANSPEARIALQRRPAYHDLAELSRRIMAGEEGLRGSQLSVPARWALSHIQREPELMGNLIARFVPDDLDLVVQHSAVRIEAQWSRLSPALKRYLSGRYPEFVSGLALSAAALAIPPT